MLQIKLRFCLIQNVPLISAAAANHVDADCFVCVFLSHGENGHIYANDGQIEIQEVTDLFKGNKCRSLVGKPKIFILQVICPPSTKCPLLCIYSNAM